MSREQVIAEPFDWSFVHNALSCDCRNYANQVCDKCQSWAAIRQLQASNAEQAAKLAEFEANKPVFSYRHFKAKAEAAKQSLRTLLAGVEAVRDEMDSELLGWKPVEAAQVHFWTDRLTAAIKADNLKALREGV